MENKIVKAFINFLKENEIDGLPFNIIETDKSNLTNKSNYIGIGYPFIPSEFIPPKDMYPVIQLNFDSISEHNMGLPKTGIFQLWAKSFIPFSRSESSEYKGVYHPSSKCDIKEFTIKWPEDFKPGEPVIIPDNLVVELKFGKLKKCPVGRSNTNIIDKFVDLFEKENPLLSKQYLDFTKKENGYALAFSDSLYGYNEIIEYLNSGSADYLLGSPKFSQGDATNSDDIQIIQIDCVNVSDVIFHIFINKDDLNSLNFENIFCTWDR